ncbi:phosphoethanolamine transferase domain-containing protein [Methylotuvimicrobium sp.]
MNGELFPYLSLLGVLPSYWLYRTPIAYSKNLQATFFSRLK